VVFARYQLENEMNDKEKYMRWLEEMWSVHKFDPHGGTEREERRREEVLEIFEGLDEIAGRRIEPPISPPWKDPLDGRDKSS
jgi:hypothetical protein